MRKISFGLALLATLSACAQPTQQPVAVDGSKSDATVVLAAEYSPNGTPPNWSNGLETAKQRCGAWGYTSAEALGAKFKTCTQTGSYGSCLRTRETVTYQCIGTTN